MPKCYRPDYDRPGFPEDLKVHNEMKSFWWRLGGRLVLIIGTAIGCGIIVGLVWLGVTG